MGRSTCVLVLGAIACDQGHAKAPPPAAHRDASATIAPTVAPTLALDGRSPDARSPDAALPQGTLYIGYPRGLVVQGDDLYFGDTGEDAQLRRMPKRGGATIVLGSDEGVYGSSGLAVSGADVFWGGELGLKKLAKTGGNVVELDHHVATRRGPIVDATSVYWFTQAENEPPYLMAMPLGGGKPRRVARGSASSFVVQGMAVDDSQVYWVDDSQHVFAAPKHGGATANAARAVESRTGLGRGTVSLRDRGRSRQRVRRISAATDPDPRWQGPRARRAARRLLRDRDRPRCHLRRHPRLARLVPEGRRSAHDDHHDRHQQRQHAARDRRHPHLLDDARLRIRGSPLR